MIAVGSQSLAERAFEETVTWFSERTAFAKPFNDKQVPAFVMNWWAECGLAAALDLAALDMNLTLRLL